MSVVKTIIVIAMILLGVNLLLTVGNLGSSPLFSMSGEVILEGTDTWALRGQIGDILSGHFSALAFLAVAISIILQNEANKQMKDSIDKQEKALVQQGKALKVQSKSLEAQIEELKASRKESSKQTEEFAISNMNIKLDRYYKLLNDSLEQMGEHAVNTYAVYTQYINDLLVKYNKKDPKEFLKDDTIPEENRIAMSEYYSMQTSSLSRIQNIMQILNHIYNDLEILNLNYPTAYEIFIKELSVRLYTDARYWDIYKNYKDSKEHCLAFRLFDK